MDIDNGWLIVWQNIFLYLQGVGITLFLTISSLLVGLVISVLCFIAKNSKYFLLKWLVNSYSFYFRGTPCLIQIFLIYYGLAQFEVMRESFLWFLFEQPLFCAWLALTLNTGAYTTEIIYGGVKATSKNEIEAIKSFGFNNWQSLIYFFMPSVARRILPVYCSESIFLMQATALASTVTVIELTQVARIINSRFFIPFESFITAAIFYMLISYSFILLFRQLEKKYCKHLSFNH